MFRTACQHEAIIGLMQALTGRIMIDQNVAEMA